MQSLTFLTCISYLSLFFHGVTALGLVGMVSGRWLFLAASESLARVIVLDGGLVGSPKVKMELQLSVPASQFRGWVSIELETELFAILIHTDQLISALWLAN